LRGWRQLGKEVGARFAEMPRLEQTFVVVAAGRAETSELAFYMPQQPRIYLWNETGSIGSQYDVWGGPKDKEGWDAMILTADSTEPPEALRAAFQTVEPKANVCVQIGPDRRRTYRLWRGVDLRRWPNPTENPAMIARKNEPQRVY